MIRVASASTSNNFRPGFRFYWDANCTEADRITTASSNARVLAPVNYDGTSNSTGNWQSTNASLTYNNGITCNCNVTGADWQVSTANAWTPTRNFGIVFRVPNAFSVSTTVTHSMRVMLARKYRRGRQFRLFRRRGAQHGPRNSGYSQRPSPRFRRLSRLRLARRLAAPQSRRHRPIRRNGRAGRRHRHGNIPHALRLRASLRSQRSKRNRHSKGNSVSLSVNANPSQRHRHNQLALRRQPELSIRPGCSSRPSIATEGSAVAFQ